MSVHRTTVVRYLADNWPWETSKVEIELVHDPQGIRYIVVSREI